MKPLLIFFCGCITGGIIVAFISQFILSKFKKQLYFDKLTGLKNTNYLDKTFNKYLQRDSSYILIDIDNFKQLNTEVGYETADKILKSFVKVIVDFVRPGIEIFRFKFGDEILIIMNNKSGKEAEVFLNDIGHKLHTTQLNIDSKKFIIYFSAGITLFKEGDNQSSITDRLINALNTAKIRKNHFVFKD